MSSRYTRIINEEDDSDDSGNNQTTRIDCILL